MVEEEGLGRILSSTKCAYVDARIAGSLVDGFPAPYAFVREVSHPHFQPSARTRTVRRQFRLFVQLRVWVNASHEEGCAEEGPNVPSPRIREATPIPRLCAP